MLWTYYRFNAHLYLGFSISGVKIPDENLTPEQLQHRQEQMAKIQALEGALLGPRQPVDTSSAPTPTSTQPSSTASSSMP